MTHTKKSILADARKRWPKCYLIENPKALSAAAKQAARDKVKELREVEESLILRLDQYNAAEIAKILREASRTCCMQRGSAESLERLAAALGDADELETLRAQRIDVAKQRRQADSGLHQHRYEIADDSNIAGIRMSLVHAHGDTLEALAEAVAKAKI
jgi:hypothetical protein